MAAIVFLLVCACASSDQSATRPSPSAQAIAGGCAGTVLSLAEPPVWAQGGWGHVKGTPWPVPWAMATTGDAVAYVFTTELVAASNQNKVLWVTEDPSVFTVEGRPLGQDRPVVTVAGGPSLVDVPTSGCWTFQLLRGKRASVINLEVLPPGATP